MPSQIQNKTFNWQEVPAIGRDGKTPLHLAVENNQLEMARTLIKTHADPFQKDKNGCSPLDLAKKNIVMIRILTGTDQIKAFDQCKNIHDFFAVLFPPNPQQLPPSHEKLEREFAPSKPLIKLELEGKSAGMRFSKEKFLRKISKIDDRVDLKTFCELLKQEAPLFNLAWSLAEHPQKLRLNAIADAHFSKENRMHPSGVGAEYEFVSHTITINDAASNSNKIYSLFFETINAVQKQELEKTVRWGITGKLDREEFAFCKEFIELRSFNWAEQMLQRRAFDVLSDWQRSNQSQGPGLISHTDEIRHAWDNDLGFTYLQSHPDFLPKRLQDLQNLS